MNYKTFIEQCCVIKDKENNIHHIKLKDYQLKFIKWYDITHKYEQTKGKTEYCTGNW